MYEIHDALYGDIVLSEEEANLLNTWEVQRLRRVKQLGFAYLVYPTAVHTRFEHSLGARYMIEHVIKASKLSINEEDLRYLYIAALLHDISHPAFSHVSERLTEVGINIPTHDEMRDEMIYGTLRERVTNEEEGFLDPDECLPSISDLLDANDKRRIMEVLTGEKLDKPFLKELIDGPIDDDNLDYLRRDAYHIGLPRAYYDDRIFSSFVIAEKDGEEHILFRDSPDTRAAILSVLEARYWLLKIVYRHHTTLIAERMFLWALETGLPREDGLKLYAYGDEEFLSFFKRKAKEKEEKDLLMALNDVSNRRLYKRAFMTDKRHDEKTIEDAKKKNLEIIREEIERKAELGFGEILIDGPKESKWKEGFDVLLNTSSGKISKLSDYAHTELTTLKEQYKSTELFGIYIRPKGEKTKDYAERVLDYCKRIDWNGYYRPKEPLEVQAKEQYKVQLIVGERIRRNKKASLKILKTFMAHDKWLSREEVAKMNDVKPTTASQYISYLNEVFRESELRLFETKREGGVKKWRLEKRIREHLKVIL